MKLDSLRFHILAAALIAATILLMWFGYRATSEWQRSTRLLVEQRTLEVSTLMNTALSRDMRGVQSQILPQLDPLAPHADPHELGDEIGKVFARFPYPESFFSWTAEQGGKGTFYVFNRADRQPAWQIQAAQTDPVTILKDPKELEGFTGSLRKQAKLRPRLILFETPIGSDTYQVIARPVYGGPAHETLYSVIGFTVNIGWVRDHYFSELTNQVSRIVDGNNSMALQILDERGQLIASSRAIPDGKANALASVREQQFPLFFFDPVLRAIAPDQMLPVRQWTARAQAVDDQSSTAAASGSRRTFLVISLAGFAAVVALILTVRAARAAALLATMKSEFVSTVTHELKTPLSSIRLVSETLARRRFESVDKISEYAGLLLNDVTRLTRTVNNLLTFSRIEDVNRFYAFEPVDPGTLLEEALESFHSQLKEQNFDVAVDIPAPLPTVRVDRTAILQVLENLMDNAIRYSNGTRSLNVSASGSATEVRMKIADKGQGIPANELPRVFDKFFRGRDSSSSGSGLGLAIVQRIVKDHHGEVHLDSVVGSGTVAEVILPVSERSDGS